MITSGQDAGTVDGGSCVASSREYGSSCTDTEGGESDAKTTGLSDHSQSRAFRTTSGQGHASLTLSGGGKTWLPKSVARGIPDNRIQQCVDCAVGNGR